MNPTKFSSHRPSVVGFSSAPRSGGPLKKKNPVEEIVESTAASKVF
jgi:hypothetical protein